MLQGRIRASRLPALAARRRRPARFLRRVTRVARVAQGSEAAAARTQIRRARDPGFPGQQRQAGCSPAWRARRNPCRRRSS